MRLLSIQIVLQVRIYELHKLESYTSAVRKVVFDWLIEFVTKDEVVGIDR